MTDCRHTLILVNAIGSTLEERLIPAGISPVKMAMSGSHVVVSSAAAAYIWQYKNQASRTTQKRAPEFTARTMYGVFFKCVVVTVELSYIGWDRIKRLNCAKLRNSMGWRRPQRAYPPFPSYLPRDSSQLCNPGAAVADVQPCLRNALQ